jgi:DNA-binding Lrp family transcriptional regulator
MDTKDLAILAVLIDDSRKTTKEIAREVGMPRATVHERIKKLKRDGVIKKFTTEVDYAKLGKPVKVFILVSFVPGAKTEKNLAKEIAKISGVEEVHLIAGDWDIMLKVRGETLEKIGDFILDKLREMPGVGKTMTWGCFSTVKE